MKPFDFDALIAEIDAALASLDTIDAIASGEAFIPDKAVREGWAAWSAAAVRGEIAP